MSCDSNCSQCGSNKACGELKKFFARGGIIKHIVGVMSGKGGVGKSTITSLLASNFNKKGYKVGILDADITGPSIPHSFGISGRLEADDNKMFIPLESKNGIKIVSTNLILENESDPVLWRGPILGGAVKQFYDSTKWGTLDYLFIDMPPGTSDVALTIFQSIPLDGVIMVTTPQSLVEMVVDKAINMAQKMNIKVLGMVENYSYVLCNECNNKIEIFGHSRLEEVSKKFDILPLAKMPIDTKLVNLMDCGKIEEYDTNELDFATSSIEAYL